MESGKWKVESVGVHSVKCKVESVKCGVESGMRKVWGVQCKV